MTRLHNAPASTPRWPILGALVAVVLGAHLVLLAGGVTLNLPGWPDNGVTAVPGAVSALDQAPAGQAARHGAAHPSQGFALGGGTAMCSFNAKAPRKLTIKP